MVFNNMGLRTLDILKLYHQPNSDFYSSFIRTDASLWTQHPIRQYRVVVGHFKIVFSPMTFLPVAKKCDCKGQQVIALSIADALAAWTCVTYAE